MTLPTLDVDPFAPGVHPIDAPGPAEGLRAAGPLVRTEAPAGGPVWLVTDATLARTVLTDDRIVKDTAWAPPQWGGWRELEPTAAARPALSSLEGDAHVALRRAHAPSFTASRIRAHGDRIADIARALLDAAASGAQPVDLAADLTLRFPTTVVCDVLGVPSAHVDDTMAACRGLQSGDPDRAMAGFLRYQELGAEAVRTPGGAAAELRERLPDTPLHEIAYDVFGMLFAGQVTTAAGLGFVLARALTEEGRRTPAAALVTETLHAHPPTRYTLWRFTAQDVEIAGQLIPARSPVLIAVEACHATGDADLTFAAGPHFCIGSRLALTELTTLVEVLRTRFPAARLAVDYDDLRRVDAGGRHGSQVQELPVRLR